MGRASPCRGWDLETLLAHLNDSLAALQEAAALGEVGLHPGVGRIDSGGDPVAALRDRACQMLGVWTSRETGLRSAVAGLPIPTELLTGAGAIELAVHGWDVAVTCGGSHHLPAALAEDLLDCATVLVLDDDRPARFGEAVAVAPSASAERRLLAFVGRDSALLR